MQHLYPSITNNVDISLKIRIFRSLFLKILQQVQHGYICITDQIGSFTCGSDDQKLKAHIVVEDMNFYASVFYKGSIGFSISYMNAHVKVDNLTNLLSIFASNLPLVEKSENNLFSFVFKLIQNLLFVLKLNTINNSKQNILDHYDLSNELFSLFLDKEMSYSSLIFKNIDESINSAANTKLQIIFDTLNLKPTDSLLEIGTGWGALAINAALKFNCKTTTTTISDSQYSYVQNRIAELQLEEQITLMNKDYRNLTGKFNKLVSIEMIEAVGYQYLVEYFKKCSSLLEDDGLLLLQTILIRDDQYERAKHEMDFIKKFIFPGGCLPSMRAIINVVTEHTDLSLVSCNDITLDYAITLDKWRRNFMNNKQAIIDLGFDNYFINMWMYYFSYCEAGFLNRNITCVQILLAKPKYVKKTLA